MAFIIKHSGYNNNTILTNGNTNTQKFKFENKECQDALGLNWYDFGRRTYMPDIVRTPQLDLSSTKCS